MARTNKYTSINFNHILEKNLSASSSPGAKSKHPQNQTHQQSSSFSSYSSISSPTTAKTHGRMLVLTRPTPKPVTAIPPLSPTPQQPQTRIGLPDQAPSDPAPDHISLRPLGRTGVSPPIAASVSGPEREKEVASFVVGSPKPEKFLPPHLRPGFAGREERPGPEVFRGREPVQKHFGSPGRFGEDGRPKSGGHERMRRGGETDLGLMSRPRSSGNRPSSSG